MAYSWRDQSPAVRPARIRAVSLSDYSPVRAPAQRNRAHLPHVRLRDDTRRALPVVVAVAAAGTVGLGFAIASVASSGLGWSDLAGIGVLLAAATLAEAFPFPIEGVAASKTSLATIFLVAVATVYGWAVAGIVGFLAMVLVEVGRRRPFGRIAFNCGVYALGGIAAGGAATLVDDGTLLGLVLAATSAAASFWLVDITLLAVVVSRSRQIRIVPAWPNFVISTSVPFAIMASLSAILVVLWDRSPYVAVILVVPLLATALYQRWIHGALERLREFDRLKDEFIAVVSHELRTPLTSVYGAALTLRQQELDDDRRNTLLEIVSTEAARLGRLLDDVLWVSRLDSDRADTFISDVDALEVVFEVVHGARTHLPETLSIEIRHPEAPPTVAADPDKLRQVLVNLVENAVKYSGEGRIDIALEPHDGHMRFSVRDEGLGISLEDQSRIFEKFHRLDPEMTRGVGGSGLGLYICKGLVERMNGQIWVESTLGRGSTFVFELPLAATA
jgi:signal transduction histidine kinase